MIQAILSQPGGLQSASIRPIHVNEVHRFRLGLPDVNVGFVLIVCVYLQSGLAGLLPSIFGANRRP